jgi:hypothetical protein
MGVKILNFLQTNDYLNNITRVLNRKHFLFFNGKMNGIDSGESWMNDHTFHINYELSVMENHILTKLKINNLTNKNIPVKLFVKNFLDQMQNNYVFASPKRDVLFLTNKKGLFLSSGVLNGTSICQYGVLKRNDYVEKIKSGTVPLYPIGTGDVIGIYTLEHNFKPYEEIVAHTWVMFSEQFYEKQLLSWDNQLKSRLAFSK